jgi:hypothetical protein
MALRLLPRWTGRTGHKSARPANAVPALCRLGRLSEGALLDLGTPCCAVAACSNEKALKPAAGSTNSTPLGSVASHVVDRDLPQEVGTNGNFAGERTTVRSNQQQRHCHARREEREGDTAVPAIVEVHQGDGDQNAKTRKQ